MRFGQGLLSFWIWPKRSINEEHLFAYNSDDGRLADTSLDLIGLKCPLPVLRTRKALRALADGDRLEVACTDPLSVIDIPHLLRQTGDALEGMEEKDNVVTFHIRRVKKA